MITSASWSNTKGPFRFDIAIPHGSFSPTEKKKSHDAIKLNQSFGQLMFVMSSSFSIISFDKQTIGFNKYIIRQAKNIIGSDCVYFSCCNDKKSTQLHSTAHTVCIYVYMYMYIYIQGCMMTHTSDDDHL